MISYSWGYKKTLVDRLYKFLVEKGYEVWKDDEGGMKGHLVDDMAGKMIHLILIHWIFSKEAVENADFVIVCFSMPYAQSKNCKKELEYADELGKELILVKLDPDADVRGHGAFSMILAKLLYVSYQK